MERRALIRLIAIALCASALATSAAVTRAQTIDLSLNLRFNDPADPLEGGVWYLVAKTTGGSPNAGIAGLSAYLLGINPTAFHGSTVPLPAGQNPAHGSYPVVTQATINNLSNSGGSPYNGPISGSHNVVYGQDTSTGPPSPPAIIGGIGKGSGAGNVSTDPMRNSSYNNYAVLLSGTFPGGATAATLPRFAPLSGGTITDGNVLQNTTPGTAALDATIAAGNLHVRGDSLGSLNLNAAPGQGLLRGDITRDSNVDGDDLALVLLRYGNTPPVGGFTWDQGDVTDDGAVNGDDLAEVLLRYNNSGVPPGLSAAITPASEAIGAAVPGINGDFDSNGQVDGRDFLTWQRGQSPNPRSAGDLAIWKANYGSGSEVAAVAAPMFAADFDGDGDVDANDLGVWRSSYTAGNANADADDDGDSDSNDVLIWQRQVGQTPVTASISAVPEPHSIGLMILGALALGTVRRRTSPQSD